MKIEDIQKVLQDIQDRVPASLKKNVFSEKMKTPTMAFLAQKIIDDKVGTEEYRGQIQALIDSGEFSKKMVVENPKIVKLIDQFVSREIKKAIKMGKLPKDATEFLPKIKEIYENIHKATNTK